MALTIQNTLKDLWNRRFIRVCVYLVTALILFLLSLPHTLRIGIERWLLQNGADEATISKVAVNIFTGEASLHGIDVQVGGKTVLANSDIFLNLGLGALFSHEALIQNASLHKISLDLEQYEDGHWRIGSLTLPKGSEKEELATGTKNSWLFLAHVLELSDSTVVLTQPDLKTSLFVKQAKLEEFTTGLSEKGGTLSLIGTLNNAPFALQLETLRIAPEFDINGTIKTSGLQLDDLEKLLQDNFNPFSGTAGADGQVNIQLSGNNVIAIDFEGGIDLVDCSITAPGKYATNGRELTWNGQVHYRQDEKNGRTAALSGSLEGKNLAVHLPEQNMNLQEEMIRIEGNVEINAADSVTVLSGATVSTGKTYVTLPAGTISDEGLQWQGTVSYNSGNVDIKEAVNAAGKIFWKNPSISSEYSQMPLVIAGRAFSWEGQLDFETDTEQLTAGMDGELGLEGINLKLDDVTSQGGRILWQGSGAYNSSTSDKTPAVITMDGRVDGTDLHAVLPNKDMELSQNTISMKTQSTMILADPFSVKGSGSLLAEGFQLRNNGAKNILASFDHFAMEGIQASQDLPLAVQLVTLEQLQLAQPGQQRFQANFPKITLNSIKTNNFTNFGAENLRIDSLKLTGTEEKVMLMEFAHLAAESINVDQSSAAAAEQITVQDLALFRGEANADADDFLHLAGLTMQNPGWLPDGIFRSDSALLNNLQVRIIRGRDGQLNITQRLQKLAGTGKNTGEGLPATTNEHDETGGKRRSADYAVNKIEVTGKSFIQYKDNSVPFPFTSDLQLNSVLITGIDSNHPEKPAAYALQGTVDQYAPLTIEGTAFLLNEDYSLSLTGNLKNYPLVHLAPYGKHFLGIIPTAGTLNSESTLSIAQGNLNFEENLLLKKLEIKTVNQELATQLDNQLPLPLNAALSLLRDSDNTISLPITLNGPIEELDFGVSGIFITPLSKAIVTGASSYLTYALGPYGALAYLGVKVGEKMLQTNLPAVTFEPGLVELTEEHKQYLERIADFLTNRPKVDIQLCAFVLPMEHRPGEKQTEKDNSPEPVERSDDDTKELINLGNSRALAIRDYLVKTFGIEAGRILICLPALDEKSGAVPRVDLQI